MTDPPILVSGCLAGVRCRFDGRARTDEDIVDRFEAGDAIPVCPELLGGMPAPRRPAEIVGGDGDDVLDGRARVLDEQGSDVTAAVVAGARRTLAVAHAAGARQAVLKDRSPSCGTDSIYDGSFEGVRRPGVGVTTALLRRHGVEVVSEVDAARPAARARKEEVPESEG